MSSNSNSSHLSSLRSTFLRIQMILSCFWQLLLCTHIYHKFYLNFLIQPPEPLSLHCYWFLLYLFPPPKSQPAENEDTHMWLPWDTLPPWPGTCIPSCAWGRCITSWCTFPAGSPHRLQLGDCRIIYPVLCIMPLSTIYTSFPFVSPPPLLAVPFQTFWPGSEGE